MSAHMVSASGVSLSKREQDVVRCVAEGLTNREIAGRLTLTEHTVKNYLFRIFDKLGVSSRVEVVLYAFNLGRSFSPAAASSVPVAVAGKDRVLPLQPVRRPAGSQEISRSEAGLG
jgi:DNA-binding CsgD family transcriptional regulator